MHEYRRFIQSELDTRGWRQSDLARASGLSRQLVSTIVTSSPPLRAGLPWLLLMMMIRRRPREHRAPRTRRLKLSPISSQTTKHPAGVIGDSDGVLSNKLPTGVRRLRMRRRG